MHNRTAQELIDQMGWGYLTTSLLQAQYFLRSTGIRLGTAQVSGLVVAQLGQNAPQCSSAFSTNCTYTTSQQHPLGRSISSSQGPGSYFEGWGVFSRENKPQTAERVGSVADKHMPWTTLLERRKVLDSSIDRNPDYASSCRSIAVFFFLLLRISSIGSLSAGHSIRAR